MIDSSRCASLGALAAGSALALGLPPVALAQSPDPLSESVGGTAPGPTVTTAEESYPVGDFLSNHYIPTLGDGLCCGLPLAITAVVAWRRGWFGSARQYLSDAREAMMFRIKNK